MENNTNKETNAETSKLLMLGFAYYTGIDSMPKDYHKAVEYFTKAAELGDFEAQYNLGVCYDYGRGVAQDRKKAADLYQKAADKGHSIAQFNLASLYESGDGVPQDFVKAAEYYKASAEQDNDCAQFKLANCYYEGSRLREGYRVVHKSSSTRQQRSTIQFSYMPRQWQWRTKRLSASPKMVHRIGRAW